MLNQKGFTPIILLLAFLLISGGIIGGSFLIKQNYINPNSSPSPKPIILPSSSSTTTIKDISCIQDDQCPGGYKCQVSESTGTACPGGTYNVSTGISTSPKEPCQPTTKIIKGQCKLVEGGSCQTDNGCYAGLICHRNICTSQISKVSCSGFNDSSCPDGYKCVQGCGPPVARVGDKPPGYFCEVEELANKPRNCPICLASNTQISTPRGEINIKNLRLGMKVYSANRFGQRIIAEIIKISNTLTPITHKVIHLMLADGRELWVSPNHPTINDVEVGQLQVGQRYDNSIISNIELVPYWDNKTYDLLPDSETGFYWANGILMDSTLKQ